MLSSLLRQWYVSTISQRRSKISRRRKYLAQLCESLECRILPATFVVTNNHDAGTGSLRDAIELANSSADHDFIEFDISGSDKTIYLQSTLPSMTQPLTVDGWSQPGFSAQPLITLNGGNAGNSYGLIVSGDSSVVRGLVIQDFERSGILINRADGVQVQGNFIGTSTNGSSTRSNDQYGVLVFEASNNIVGVRSGSSEQHLERNIISGNGDGVYIAGGSNNVIAGNFVGLAADGESALPNQNDGIVVAPSSNGSAAQRNLIGGDSPGERNVVAGNLGDGIAVWSAPQTTITGNYVGVAVDGIKMIGNGGRGIRIGVSSSGMRGDSSVIGGPEDSLRNVIGGNGSSGIELRGVSETHIIGNSIGIAADGSTPVPNQFGIHITAGDDFDAVANVIGGDTDSYGNIISGNSHADGGHGIVLTNGAHQTIIRSNRVGTDRDGVNTVPNTRDGIVIHGSTETQVSENVISGNGLDGLSIEGEASRTTVTGNHIGVSSGGGREVSNGAAGVRIWDKAIDTNVGGLTPGLANVISGNTYGVFVHGEGTTDNAIVGNLIGTNNSGSAVIPNRFGVVITEGASRNTVGGTDAGARNLISGNLDFGVFIADVGTEFNRVEGNWIGPDKEGNESLGNQRIGVVLRRGTQRNQIGSPGAGNVISGHTFHGIYIDGFETTDNVFHANYIGTDTTGLSPLGNKTDGIKILGAGPNQFGGVQSGEGNVISGNGDDGIHILRGAQGQVIQGNFIGVGADGSTPIGNTWEGIEIEGGELQGIQPTILYVVDVSPSALNSFAGKPVGDINGDGIENTILDAELAGLIDFTETLNAMGLGDTVRIGVITFGGTAQSLDMDPILPDVQPIALAAADENNNGKSDVLEALNGIRTISLTHYSAALREALDVLAAMSTTPGDGNLIFLSDGDNIGGSFQQEIDDLDARGTNRIALGMGASSSLPDLQEIDPDAVQVHSTDEFTDYLLSILGLSPGQSGSNGPVGTNILVGGTEPGAGNVIANNGADGVDVQSFLATGNAILGNSIYNNVHLGIELGETEPEPNDPLDADSGANDLTNYPIIEYAALQGDNYDVSGRLEAKPNQGYRIEFFGNPVKDETGYGEGTYFLGALNVTTHSDGAVEFSGSFAVSVTDFQSTSATATTLETYGNTSEFSAAADVIRRVPGISVVESNQESVVGESGNTDSLDVTLTAQPGSPVELSITSDDLTELSIDVSTLHFTPATWNIPQTVVLRGEDDALVDGNRQANVTISVVDANSDQSFHSVDDQTISVTNLDDDVAGITVSISNGSTIVDEFGTTDSFSVVLDSQPFANVVLLNSVENANEIEISARELVFTPTNWNQPQTIVVTGIDDESTDGDQTTSIQLGIDIPRSSNEYSDVGERQVFVVTRDDDVSGFSLVETNDDTVVSESGTTDAFLIALASRPISPVVLTVTSDDAAEVTVSTATLTFTALNWNVAQSVKVQAVDDRRIDGEQNTAIRIEVIASLSDDAFDNLPIENIVVQSHDNDTAALVVNETDSQTRLSESGTQDTIEVSLSGEPLSDVLVDITSSDTTEVSVSPVQLVFTPGNWSVIRYVTLTGMDDELVDGERSAQIELHLNAASDAAFSNLPDQTIDVTTEDDDEPGFEISQARETTISEDRDSDAVGLVLSSAPITPVVIRAIASDSSEVRIPENEIQFSAENWDVPQLFVIYGVDDNLVDGAIESLVRFEVISDLSDDAFGDVPPQSIVVTTTDNDTPGIIVAESYEVVTESGTSDFVEVSLPSQPLNDVVLQLEFSDSTEATVTRDRLTFTNSNWNEPQSVILLAIDDEFADGNQETYLVISVITQESDAAFASSPDKSILVNVVDNEVPGLVVLQTDGAMIVSESGAGDEFSVQLSVAPITDVVLFVENPNPTTVELQNSRLLFTPDQWNIPQSVVVNAIENPTVDGTRNVHLQIGIEFVSSSIVFHDVPKEKITVEVLDDDYAGFQVSSNLLTIEEGTKENVAISLAGQPKTNVVIRSNSENENQVVTEPTTLTFSPQNWNIPQQVEIWAPIGEVFEQSRSVRVRFRIDTENSDAAFQDVPDQSLTVTITDRPRVNLDIDNDNSTMALTDGILLLRFMAGFRGDALTDNAVSHSGSRSDPTMIANHLLQGDPSELDVDGNGQISPLTDGILFLRYMAGFRGEALVASAVDLSGSRWESTVIETWLAERLSTSTAQAASSNPTLQETKIVTFPKLNSRDLDELFAVDLP